MIKKVLVLLMLLSTTVLADFSKDAEKELGRIRNEGGYASRTMDIDLLFYDNQI